MGKTTFQVEGMSELLKRCRKLPVAMEKRVYRDAVKKAGEVVRKAAQGKVPVDTGTTAGAVVVRVSSKPREGLFGVKITLRGPKLASQRVAHRRGKGAEYHPDEVTRYYRFQELGTKHHPAQPFLNPALEGEASAVLRVMKEELGKGLERVTASL